MPTAIASHASFMIGDDFIVLYGGTNGQTLFNSVIRYDIKQKRFMIMSKWPGGAAPKFQNDGRIALVSAVGPVEDGDQIWVLFGGCSDTEDCNDFLVLRKKHLIDDSNFQEFNVII